MELMTAPLTPVPWLLQSNQPEEPWQGMGVGSVVLGWVWEEGGGRRA